MCTTYNKGRHSVYLLRYHMVFVTKYRGSVFNNNMLLDIETIITTIFKKLDMQLIEFNGEPDHIHMIVGMNPMHASLAIIVNFLKSAVSRRLRNKYPIIGKMCYGRNTKLWSRSYFVATVGDVSIDTLKKYIKNQNRPAVSPTC